MKVLTGEWKQLRCKFIGLLSTSLWMLSLQLFFFPLADGDGHVTSLATRKARGRASGIRGRCASITSLGATTNEPVLKDVNEPDGASLMVGSEKN